MPSAGALAAFFIRTKRRTKKRFEAVSLGRWKCYSPSETRTHLKTQYVFTRNVLGSEKEEEKKKGGVGCAGRFRLLFPGRFAMETFLDEARLLQRELSPDRRCFDGTRRLRTEALRSSLARCLRGCRDLRNFVAIAQLSAGMIDHSVRSAERGASGKAVGLLLSVSLPTGRQWHFRPGKTVENFVLSS